MRTKTDLTGVSVLILALLTLAAALSATPARAASLAATFSDANNRAQPGFLVFSPDIINIERTAARGTDFPATATTPGFTYTYNPDLDLYERSSVSLGPAFLERAETLGKGRWDLGVSYLYADFTHLNGDPLESDTASRTLLVTSSQILGTPEPTAFTRFTLTSNAVYFSSSYGITDDWDVNVLVPVFFTTFQVRERFISQDGTPGTVAANGYKAGPGDVQLRTKYRVLESGAFRLAPALSLILPSGNKDDFQGLGDTRLVPSAVGSYAWSRFDAHASVGIEVNAADIDRSRGRYGVGLSYGFIERLTGLVDLIGTSSFTSEDVFIAHVLESGQASQVPGVKVVPSGDGFDLFAVLDRTDIVDLSIGLKVNPFGNFVAFASAIVPVTSDGVRADVIPAIGISYSH